MLTLKRKGCVWCGVAEMKVLVSVEALESLVARTSSCLLSGMVDAVLEWSFKYAEELAVDPGWNRDNLIYECSEGMKLNCRHVDMVRALGGGDAWWLALEDDTVEDILDMIGGDDEKLDDSDFSELQPEKSSMMPVEWGSLGYAQWYLNFLTYEQVLRWLFDQELDEMSKQEEQERMEAFRAARLDEEVDAEEKVEEQKAMKIASRNESRGAKEPNDVVELDDEKAWISVPNCRGRRKRSVYSCFCCGETGHFKRSCPKRLSSCSGCGTVGHTKDRCWKSRGSKCFCCGLTGHLKAACWRRNDPCMHCGIPGHVPGLCWRRAPTAT